jgi:hypothetical protein
VKYARGRGYRVFKLIYIQGNLSKQNLSARENFGQTSFFQLPSAIKAAPFHIKTAPKGKARRLVREQNYTEGNLAAGAIGKRSPGEGMNKAHSLI